MVATSLPAVGTILGRRTHESHVKPCPAGLFLLGNGCSKFGSHKLILLIEDHVFLSGPDIVYTYNYPYVHTCIHIYVNNLMMMPIPHFCNVIRGVYPDIGVLPFHVFF